MSEDEDTSDDKEPEYVSYRPPDADEQAAEEQPTRSIFDFDSEEAKEEKEAPKTTKLDASEIQNLDQDRKQQESKQGAGGEDGSSSSRSAATTVTVVALLILAMIGGWIVLGQQGIVPPPSRTLGLSNSLTDPAATGGNESTSTADATGDAAGEPSGEDIAAPPTTSPETDDASSPSVRNSGTDAADDGASTGSRGFDRSAGGFTIAVASRETESQARALVDQFRRNLSDTNLRVDVVVGESSGTTRYRVGVGQFSTRAEANNVRNEMQNRLPDGAWPVSIE